MNTAAKLTGAVLQAVAFPLFTASVAFSSAPFIYLDGTAVPKGESHLGLERDYHFRKGRVPGFTETAVVRYSVQIRDENGAPLIVVPSAQLLQIETPIKYVAGFPSFYVFTTDYSNRSYWFAALFSAVGGIVFFRLGRRVRLSGDVRTG
ncbi:hypothetical protein [Nibricoccus aquaticus]|uniref:hypothetical protein n=1 Tax=Nibricoccus aquaticus TaxID=2576891 RepID=UPI0010FD9667|nr:hypothetical protein [Nibricoccus aquaticus]